MIALTEMGGVVDLRRQGSRARHIWLPLVYKVPLTRHQFGSSRPRFFAFESLNVGEVWLLLFIWDIAEED